VFPEDGATCIELIEKADQAMYQSKASQQRSIHFYTSNSNKIE